MKELNVKIPTFHCIKCEFFGNKISKVAFTKWENLLDKCIIYNIFMI
jgi:hypothetical protein